MPRFAASLLAPAVARFHRHHPEVEVDVAIVHRRELELAVANQSFDLGIGALPLHNPGIESHPLLSLPAVVVRRGDRRALDHRGGRAGHGRDDHSAGLAGSGLAGEGG